MNQNRWKVNRGGFLNFWKHDETELIFEDGKMLLHGPNGSGKTMSMTSLITPVLDGKTTPERLDPFESKSRKMRDVLLGKQNAPMTDSRIGYMYLEYRKGETNQYLTTIVGLEAVPNKVTPHFWGGFLLNNRRIGIGMNALHLYNVEDVNGQPIKVPLSKKQLTTEIGDSGFVVDNSEDYLHNVNKYLFGFATKQKYQDFIKLLIQLRTPKLSSAKTTGIKPSTLNEILRDSLPEITMEDLQSLIETIETIDTIKKDKDQQKQDRNLIKGIANPYLEYNDLLLYTKARNVLDADRRLRGQLTKDQDLKKQLKVKESELNQTETDITKLELQLQATEETIQSLQTNQDIFSLQEEQTKLMNEHKEYEQVVTDRRIKLQKYNDRLIQIQNQITNTENDIIKLELEIDEEIKELKVTSNQIGFSYHDHLSDIYKQSLGKTSFDFTEWKKIITDYEAFMVEVAQMSKEVDKLIESRSEIKREIEELESLRKKEIEQRRTFEKEYEKSQLEFVDDVNWWVENLQSLTLSIEDVKRLLKITQSLLFTVQEEDLTSFLHEKVEVTLHRFHNQLITFQANKKENMSELTRIKEGIAYWESGNLPDPTRSEDKNVIRKKLSIKGVQFLPFYKSVEFLKGVCSDETRAKIESAITEVSLLDALIVEEKYEGYVSDITVVIKTNQVKKEHNLTSYLCVAENALHLKGQILKVLEGISIEETSDGFILTTGQFSSNFISGQAADVRSMYLGETVRIHYREQLIEELEVQLKTIQVKLGEINDEIERIEVNIEALKVEREEFPSYKSLKSLKDKIDLKNQWIKEHIDKKIMIQQGILSNLNDEISKCQLEMRSQLKETSFRVESTYSFFEKCLSSINGYKNRLKSIEHSTINYYLVKNQLVQLVDRIDELNEESDTTRVEMEGFKDKIMKVNMRCENIEKQLAAKGAAEITAQLNEQLEMKMNIPGQISKLSNDKIEHLITISQLTVSLSELQTRLPFVKNFFTLTGNLFEQDQTFRLYRWGEKDIAQQAKVIEKQLKEKYPFVINDIDNKIRNADIRINAAYNQAFKMIKSYQANLERVTNEIVSNLPFSQDELSEDQNALVQNVLHYETRIIITMSCIEHGIEFHHSPTAAIERVEADIQIQELRISEKDKELYEKFLLQDLRKVIRDRISDVEYWILEMNLIMRQVKTSSKLSLKIKWVPISGDNEEEIHTRKLVKLFSIDSTILNEDEKEQVTSHFRSKISRKLQVAEMNGERIRSFKEVIHEVFDYRSWFNFEIHATLKDDDLGHLTNKVYYGLSGGEKALSMYIPLLAAVYSRYSEARKDSPRLITLDEAFAGVDENNISEIFGMLKQMDFDYIYNSQSLWGCYPTVPSIAIYDFQNTEDSDDVILFRYHWNGHTREYLGPVQPLHEHGTQLSFLESLNVIDGEPDEQSS